LVIAGVAIGLADFSYKVLRPKSALGNIIPAAKGSLFEQLCWLNRLLLNAEVGQNQVLEVG
jgi:hypothetical protein